MKSFTEASHTIATCSSIIHDDVYSSFACYDGVNDVFDGEVIRNVEREKFDSWVMS